jgi:hypothetical protein
MPKKLRKRRETLWHQFNKRCYWCGCETIFPESGCDNSPKADNLATIEHLRSKFHEGVCPDCHGVGGDVDLAAGEMATCVKCSGRGIFRDRYVPNHNNEQRLVLACLGCNGLRAKLEGKVVSGMKITDRRPASPRPIVGASYGSLSVTRGGKPPASCRTDNVPRLVFLATAASRAQSGT